MTKTAGLIKELIVEYLHVERDRVHDNADLEQDLGADSLDTVELIGIINDTFNINLDDEDIKRIKTVSDLVHCVEQIKKGNSS